MNDNHSKEDWIYRHRWLEQRLAGMVTRHPVVVVTGPRQVGKSTLLEHAGPVCKWRYHTLDDMDVQEQAQRDPMALWAGVNEVVIDEAQRVPSLFLAVKRAVDQDRKRRFVLSGSANMLLMQKVSESLAGRAVYLSLRPLTLGEWKEQKAPNILSSLLAGEIPFEGHIPTVIDPLSAAWRGFMPTLFWLSDGEEGVVDWWHGYVSTYLERDLRALSQISSLTDFRHVMALAALRTGQLVNQTEIARDSGVSQPTVHRYLNLLEISMLLDRVPAFTSSKTTRLLKSPKFYWADPGLAAFLMGHYMPAGIKDEREAGALFENLILLHVHSLSDLLTLSGRIHYWRTVSGTEVDFVLEQGRRLVAIEVKLTTTAHYRDIVGLNRFMKEHHRCKAGVLIYAGDEIVRLGERIVALPWQALTQDGVTFPSR
jgi:hypothetical protein